MRKLFLSLICFIFLLLSQEILVNANEGNEKKLDDMYDLKQLEIDVGNYFKTENISFKNMVLKVMSGDVEGAINSANKYIFGNLKTQFGGYKKIALIILLLGMISALFAELGKIFQSHQIADISYYLVYLLLITILIQVFSYSVGIAKEIMENILSFLKILIPTYYLSVGFAAGQITALTFYKLTICIIFCLESFLFKFLFPLIYSYVFLSVINGMMEEERLAKLLELLKKAIQSMLKIAIGFVSGFGIIQSMITPVIDGVKTSVFQKMVSAIPGVGGVADAATEVVYGSTILIKNSIGVVAILLLIALCAIPLLKIFIVVLITKITSAIVGIISDKRITSCIDRVGDGGMLLFKTIVTSVALFVITIAIVAVSTNRGF